MCSSSTRLTSGIFRVNAIEFCATMSAALRRWCTASRCCRSASCCPAEISEAQPPLGLQRGRMERKAPVAFGCWQRAEGHEQQKFSGSPGLLPRSSAFATGAAAAVPRRAVAFSCSPRTILVDTNDWSPQAFANAEHVRTPTSVGHRRG